MHQCDASKLYNISLGVHKLQANIITPLKAPMQCINVMRQEPRCPKVHRVKSPQNSSGVQTPHVAFERYLHKVWRSNVAFECPEVKKSSNLS